MWRPPLPQIIGLAQPQPRLRLVRACVRARARVHACVYMYAKQHLSHGSCNCEPVVLHLPCNDVVVENRRPLIAAHHQQAAECCEVRDHAQVLEHNN